MTGYSERELAEIQLRWDFRFPPDLINIYRQRRTVIPGGFDWITTPATEIRRMFDWPFEGLLFDVRNNNLWWSSWGPKPLTAFDEEAILRTIVSAAPKLIPVYGHRYIPETPQAPGNPIFSVYQSDIIYYGANLEDYYVRETGSWNAHEWPPTRTIPFWSQFTDE